MNHNKYIGCFCNINGRGKVNKYIIHLGSMKYGRISEVPLYNLSSVVIQCLITFLAMSITFIAMLTSNLLIYIMHFTG